MIIGTEGAVVGVVTQIKSHPNAEKVWLAYVRINAHHNSAQIVFGGCRKLRKGDLVAVAPPGTRVVVRDASRKKKMRARNYRGQRSHGMLCSLTELGWVKDGIDEVAVLRGLRPGDSLDAIPVADRRRHVKNWYDAVEALGAMVDEVFEPTPTQQRQTVPA